MTKKERDLVKQCIDALNRHTDMAMREVAYGNFVRLIDQLGIPREEFEQAVRRANAKT